MAIVGFMVGIWWLREREATTPALKSYEQTPPEPKAKPTKADAPSADATATPDVSVSESEAVKTETLKMASSTPDDLTAINGIGPAFERALNDIGIMTYAQLAVQAPADLAERLDTRGISTERIERDEWIEQAQQLANS